MHAETVDAHFFGDATNLMLADQLFQLAGESCVTSCGKPSEPTRW